MTRASVPSRFQWAAAVLAAVLWTGAALPARAQFFPFFGQQEAPQPAPRPLTPGEVRAVLADEGARMIGRPRLRGPNIVAIGRDAEGARKRFTIDATSGEILDVTVLARREEPRAAPGPNSDFVIPGRPLPPPEHAPEGPADAGNGGPAEVQARPLPPSAPRSAPSRSDSGDAALSPIRPLRPRGAPKVEPLPQQ
ncbi:hypothetical protein K9U39_02155 [Rhodoblastus acidophilus]|uniref:PepSY domain-containing protein n=1 Tax=Candidatus Rhodoblastus alkanivorans TaxID=2954117 RepID=A0ABS9Z445_9HYPH|nr:hypothetical protein [Candidatus Rhodoblastus alkanivorans]MCI4679226.1 hypothetical protein [Candidatus Rhodoblastus alkanivorans]MCI4682450.1 hypothetical protein [Candidatus Rhodoblastus alkanivorans]MDI4639756.1 hypothetical protein [Rhodoblastus acidophilus]